MLLDGSALVPSGKDVWGIALVEQDTVVGDATLSAFSSAMTSGTFMVHAF